MNTYEFCNAVVAQDAPRLRQFFCKDAIINWHCTNERFTVEEYIAANCKYPGSWNGEVERVETIGELIIAVLNVYPKDRSASFHAVSFIKTINGKIISMDEYWADDGDAPQWRRDMHIGSAIK